jgi:competence protein ComEC
MFGLAAADIVFGGALAFLAGIAAASLNLPTVTFIVAAAIGGFTISYLVSKFKYWKFIILLLFLFFAGAFYYHLYLNIQRRGENIPYNKVVAFLATITNEPKIYDKYQSLEVELAAPLRGDVSILTSPLKNYKYGDVLRVEGEIEPAQSAADKPTAAFPKTIAVVAEHRGFWLKEKLLDLKNYLLAQFQKSLPHDEAALMGGLTFGSRANFSEEFKNQMKLSGTTHLVALSGYNIGILVFAVAYAFGYFLPRRKTFYITLAVIFLFVLMVGAEASVVRAAIMGFLALLAKEGGRIYSPRNAIVVTALVMTLIQPTVLVFNVGFQLSFLSLLGIVYLHPALKKLLRIDEKNNSELKEIAIMTASAQFSVMPLIISVFGQFSLTAIVANTLILEFTPLTMFLGFLLAALSSIYFYLGFAVSKLAEVLLLYEICIIKFFAALSIPLPLPFGNQLFTVLYYLFIITIIYNFYPRHKSENVGA